MHTAGGRKTSEAQVAELIEQLGFGQAQVRLVFLAHGIWFVESLQVGAAMLLDAPMSIELGLSHMEQASLASIIFVGIMIGSFLSGYVADRCGRRPPLLACYALAAVAQLLVAFVQAYWQVVPLRFLIGLAHGLGMPASMALVSECTPAARRMAMMGARNVLFSAGCIFGSCFVVFDSPSLLHLHWRSQTLVAALPPLLWGACAFWLLQESPVFLVSIGQWVDAQGALQNMKGLNGGSGVAIDLISETADQGDLEPAGTRSPEVPRSGDGSLRAALGTIFGRHSRFHMLVLMVGAMAMNIVLMGHAYAFPKIASGTQLHSPVPAGYQGLLQQTVGLGIGLGVMGLTSFMSCRSMLLLASATGVVGLCLFVQTASLIDRTPLLEALYLLSQNTPGVVPSLGFLACYQLSVDLFQVRVRATSAALCVASGRVAAIFAPFLFEAVPSWQLFYISMVGLCFATLVLTLSCLPKSQEEQQDLQPIRRKAP